MPVTRSGGFIGGGESEMAASVSLPCARSRSFTGFMGGELARYGDKVAMEHCARSLLGREALECGFDG